jgi:DNA polymerase III epsilon subunit-like protein
MMNQFLFTDTETTGVDEKDRVVEIALKWYEGSSYEDGPDKFKEHSFEVRCKAPIPISIGAMSVSGIRNHEVDKLPLFNDTMIENVALPKKIMELLKTRTVVAHNAQFDIGMLQKESIECGDHICTKKLSHYIFPEMEKFNMQFLRYYFWENEGIDMSLPKGMEPHQALADVVILERVFYRIAQEFKNKGEEFTAQKAIEISNNPVLLYKYSSGKYRDNPMTYEDLVKKDPRYCDWIVNKSEMNDDIKYTVRHYTNKLNDAKKNNL